MQVVRSVWSGFWGLRWRYKAPVLLFILMLLVPLTFPREEQPESPETVATPVAQTATPPPATPMSVAATLAPVPGVTTVEAAAEGCQGPGEQVYLSLASAELATIGTGDGMFSALFQDAGRDMSLLFDSSWRQQLAIISASVTTAAERVLTLDPPASMAAIHAEVEETARLHIEALHLVTAGVDQLDADLIDQAATMMVDGAAHMDEATRLLDDQCG